MRPNAVSDVLGSRGTPTVRIVTELMSQSVKQGDIFGGKKFVRSYECMMMMYE